MSRYIKYIISVGAVAMLGIGIVFVPKIIKSFKKEEVPENGTRDLIPYQKFTWPEIEESQLQKFVKYNENGEIVIDPLVISDIIKSILNRTTIYNKGTLSFGYEIKSNEEIWLKLIYNQKYDVTSKLFRIYLKRI
ncbi:hypothetical protein C4M98_00775 [Mycoplasmopsis pullorum]|uniref:MHO_1590 family protein n=2 Tax=Mycoplasmopsis pullorum TaxID=48003 RepID=UPI00111AEC9D|nr:hypothetical protein [Mycoplasmopsis pullorum]TNK82408.1 hypothetical protein C4M94_00915 [Mycoplasmopsis pullorum]TNK82627.1 hypothetical protein C4M80_02795 [Mycoplasmopsis pullorum]TNK84902.1 hypothetical protein C4M81_00970 [Mycoplasmopsis pullorum]TNK86090.1 hypothetical protein C4M85_01390 [Mycoplasmopsis pullorum]TNK86455.1 hypothetical protein C4M82_03440 [Mycoplasmopsis pullorum]